MSLSAELGRFLTELEQAQGELRDLFAAKSLALQRIQGEELVRISEGELELGKRLQALLARRNRLLDAAGKQGIAATSLMTLTGAIGIEIREPLLQRIRLAEQRSAELRHESWIHWIISHRCYNHYTELLELIAHGGKKAPTYSQANQTTGAGGAVLDASI